MKEGAPEASIHLMLQKLRETLTVFAPGSRIFLFSKMHQTCWHPLELKDWINCDQFSVK